MSGEGPRSISATKNTFKSRRVSLGVKGEVYKKNVFEIEVIGHSEKIILISYTDFNKNLSAYHGVW